MRIEMKDGSVTSLEELSHQIETSGSIGLISMVSPLRAIFWSPLRLLNFDRLSKMASVLENCATRGFEIGAFEFYKNSQSRKQKRQGRSIMVGLIAESVVSAIRPYVLSGDDHDSLARTGFRFGLKLLHGMENTSEVQGLAIRVRNSMDLVAQRKAQRVA